MLCTARSVVRLVAASIVLVIGSVLLPQIAFAHTDFDFSVPTDGAAVGDPVSEITVAFTEPVTLVGPGFEVLDPQAQVLQPFAVTDDDIVFRLQFDPALGGGVVAVKYEVAAADGHVLGGNFTFTVAGDAPVVTEPAATPPVTEPPATTVAPASSPTTPSSVVTVPPISASVTEPSVAADEAAGGDAAAADVEATTSVTSGDDEAIGDTGDDTDDADDAGDDGSNTTLVLVGLGAVIAAAFGFVLVRSRMSQ